MFTDFKHSSNILHMAINMFGKYLLLLFRLMNVWQKQGHYDIHCTPEYDKQIMLLNVCKGREQ